MLIHCYAYVYFCTSKVTVKYYKHQVNKDEIAMKQHTFLTWFSPVSKK